MSRHTIVLWKDQPPIDWVGQDVVIVGSGPSARAVDFSLINIHTRVIAVNESWQLVPWADVLYATDGIWWSLNKGCKAFEGRKFTSSPAAAKVYGLSVVFTTGNNSGLRAIFLAKFLGARRILLVGFDMHERDGVHWHAPHNKVLHNPSKDTMRLWCNEMAIAAKRYLGDVKVINCTPGSALQCFPFATLGEALNAGVQSGADQSRHSGVA